MEMKLITSGELKNFVTNIIGTGSEIYGVQEKENGKFQYAELKDAGKLRLDYDVTLTPPKNFFSPQKETLFTFKLAGRPKTRALYETNKRILMGVHPYDMIAINQMDEVWKDKNEDAHYFQRRNHTIIIGVDPEKASSWSFWCHMDAGTVDTGYDIWLTKLGNDKYFVEARTDAGKDILKKHAKCDKASGNDSEKKDSIRARLHEVCDKDRRLSAKAGEIPLLVKNAWDHKTWKDRSEKCYSCGSCNIVCPTCYCFDVKDEMELNLTDGRRVRIWDGCQLEDFAKVGSGENFREKRVERFKHRFYRKTVYQYEKYNHLACVGCGRCSGVCLPNIADPVDIINTIKS